MLKRRLQRLVRVYTSQNVKLLENSCRGSYNTIIKHNSASPDKMSRDSLEHLELLLGHNAGPRSAVGNVSGYRCVSDCRSRGHEFDPGPVPYFRGD